MDLLERETAENLKQSAAAVAASIDNKDSEEIVGEYRRLHDQASFAFNLVGFVAERTLVKHDQQVLSAKNSSKQSTNEHDHRVLDKLDGLLPRPDEEPIETRLKLDVDQRSAVQFNRDDKEPSTVQVHRDNEEPSTVQATRDEEESSTIQVNRDDEEPSTVQFNRDEEESSALQANRDNEESSTVQATRDEEESSALQANRDDEESSTSFIQ